MKLLELLFMPYQPSNIQATRILELTRYRMFVVGGYPISKAR